MFGKEKNIENFREQIRIFNQQLFPTSNKDCQIECINEKKLVYQIPDAIEEAVLYYTVDKRKDGNYALDCFVQLGSKLLTPEEIK